VSIFSKIGSWFRRKKKEISSSPVGLPLREFIYLDEVSLRSLLSSQTGEMIDTRSEQRTEGNQVNVESSAGFRAPGLTKADITSRFQTSNSNSLQTSRKATVQSWFGELHSMTGLRLIEPGHQGTPVSEPADLLTVNNPSIALPAPDLERGKLVEFRVRLSADPIFHLGTMISEFSGIVDESPQMFPDGTVRQQLDGFLPVNKVLQRMLAGLVPIRCEALDHVAVAPLDTEYVVRRECVEGLAISTHPIQIVGVTEHLAYWKDLRRVLFSDAEFTILGRIARTGLQSSWTPIKLGDLFRVVAPDWDEQINAAASNPFNLMSGGTSVSVNEVNLGDALRHYKTAIEQISDDSLSLEQDLLVSNEINRLLPRAATATGQRSAFQIIHDMMIMHLKVEIDAERDSALRASAREESGLTLFPAMSSSTTTIGGAVITHDGPEPRLLDVEVVAIYW